MVECGLPKAETRVRFPSPAPLIINCLRNCAEKVQENQVCNLTYFWLFVRVFLNSQSTQNLGIEPDKIISDCVIVGHFCDGNPKTSCRTNRAMRNEETGILIVETTLQDVAILLRPESNDIWGSFQT